MARTYMRVEDRRRLLVQAARTVMCRHGVDGTSMRAVAAEAGVPLSAVHYAFDSKEGLLRASLEDFVTEVSQAVVDGTGDVSDLGEALRDIVLEVWETLVAARPEVQRTQYEMTLWAIRTEGASSLATWQYDLYREQVARQWEQAAHRCGVELVAPVDQLARLLLAGMDGLILQFLAEPDPARATADLGALVGALVALAAPVGVGA